MSVRLTIEGVRCFATPQQAIVRPLTLLVGENSAGKTTFLALCETVSSMLEGYSQHTSFNEPPFSPGAFEQIASYMGGRAGRVREFSLAADFEDASVRAVFASEAEQPTMKSWHFEYGPRKMMVERNQDGGIRIEFRSLSKRAAITLPREEDIFGRPGGVPFGALLQYAFRRHSEPFVEASESFEIDEQLRRIRQAFGQRPYAFAPIRASPRRTYEPTGTEPDPEGSHIPMLMARLASQAEPLEWEALQSSLDRFGSSSGLFQHIDVLRNGKRESDPFQIGIKGTGPFVNLVDVGYGVNQVLPLLVDSLQRLKVNDLFLVQQPEVHLHPRAQAELGTFFASLANKTRRFVVETHSEYLLDRVRMEVRSGKHIRAEDVSILYFERDKNGAHIHNIELDSVGSVVNPPPGYRQFFLDEELALLGDLPPV